MRLISTSMLQPDMVLAKSVYYRDCLILRAGQKDLARYIGNLHNMGIEYVYVEDKKSEGIEIPDVLSEETRLQCKTVIRTVTEELVKENALDVSAVQNVVYKVIDEILLNKDVQISLHDISSADEYTFTHSVNTMVYSLMLASRLNYSKSLLEKLAIGTLLHDIGKVLLDKDIVFKKSVLTQSEFEYVKQHALVGYNALKKCVLITELSRSIALFHHERVDGLGYPKGVKAESLHEFARIVAIADVYDALTTDRCYKKRWTNEKAANYLIEFAGKKFDDELVHTFIQLIAIYPNGSVVRLSDGSYGIIKKQNLNLPLRPVVRVYADSNGEEIEAYDMDMCEHLAITIVESEIEMNNHGVQIK